MRKANITQMNKQVTIVNVKCPPTNRRPSCKKKRPTKIRPLCHDTCGRIFQLANDGPKIYFLSIDTCPHAVVRIDNDTERLMTAIIEVDKGRHMVGTIEQGQQVSFDVPSIRNLAIECTGKEGTCKGYYLIQWF